MKNVAVQYSLVRWIVSICMSNEMFRKFLNVCPNVSVHLPYLGEACICLKCSNCNFRPILNKVQIRTHKCSVL